MKKLIVCLCIGSFGLISIHAEPSVYGDGGFFSPQKEIAKTKKELGSLKNKIAQQSEEIQGLKSVIEGLTTSVRELQNKNSDEGGTDNRLLKDLGMMIDKINTDYVSKDTFQRALGRSANVSTSAPKPRESTIQTRGTVKSSTKLYTEGVRLYGQKRYDEASKRFATTDTRGYKAASSNYYLGEIAYYMKQYKDAIFYFKKSAGLYDGAGYMDILLLHTAVSLDRNGDKKQAKAFYENIIANYQGKKSARIAESKLKEL